MADELLVYSDGSAGTDGESAAACVLIDRRLGRRLKVCVLLRLSGGPDTELLGGILGLLSIDACDYPKPRRVRWLLDSKAVIDRAERILRGSEPESAIWDCWRRLAGSCSISLEWVKGHSGHRENEACDRACRWIRTRGEEFLRERGEGPIGFAAKNGSAWLFFNGLDLGRKLEAAEDADAECASLLGKIKVHASFQFRAE